MVCAVQADEQETKVLSEKHHVMKTEAKMPLEAQKRVEIIKDGFLDVSLKLGLKQREDFHRKGPGTEEIKWAMVRKMEKHKTKWNLKAGGFRGSNRTLILSKTKVNSILETIHVYNHYINPSSKNSKPGVGHRSNAWQGLTNPEHRSFTV